MSQQDLLVEIATEELPPKSLLKLSRAFSRGLQAALEARQLLGPKASVHPFATPRRLAAVIH
ncbi:MAG: glycine--tRNA ligase subunit beta, partial [Gammaproteobacteria bacterium]|nr:glycine--tRNA ligase subunit beta [Gammaproteobacteria bacterium]